MGWLNTEKPPEKWSAAYFRTVVERIRTAVNYLDSENFPDGISGLWIKDRSISAKTKITGYGGLVFQQDFFALPTGLSFAGTTLTSLGSSVLWSPTWNNYAKLYLEVTGYVADAANSATVELHGTSGAILSKTISDTTITRYEWEVTTPPTTGMTLVCKAKVNNSTYPLTILSARLILKLTETV